ncbi:tyramine oxidase subunit B [Acetobacterium tundrae]|uniref:Ornithine cyclodeaminase n=1 Tax=Acetobacterium tundrae TaxID=132932 RepID=A0ABR6WKD4_9FIRM|nr:tyramine oxidase subunit B [Acetobacterium tundrae]MBC3796587.1 ornithine cyclodeaminase [Acetobacterium tundrae]
MAFPKIDLLYLSEADMLKAGVDDVVGCTDCMEELLKLLDKGDYRMGGDNGNSHGCMITFPSEPEFPNMPKDGPDRRFMAMPAYVGGKFDVAGMKWYGSNVENRDKKLPRSILMMMLNDKDTGAPLALMSANLLSAYRTAAIPGVGVKNLALKDAKVLAIIGPGVINSTAIETFAALRPTLTTLKIKGRGQESIDRCIAYVNEKCPQFTEIIICETLEECVRDADILSFATSTPMGSGPSAYPFVKTEWIKPGALFCLPGAADFSDELIKSDKTKLVVDNISLYEAWAEEYPYPTFDMVYILGSKFMDMIHDGKLEKSAIHDLGAILNGKIPGRESDDQIILYSVGGMPVEDVAWGKEVYDYARKNTIGVDLNLWDKPALY